MMVAQHIPDPRPAHTISIDERISGYILKAKHYVAIGMPVNGRDELIIILTELVVDLRKRVSELESVTRNL